MLSNRFSPFTVDNLRKPRLLKPVSCYLERIAISLSPNAEQFESELCHIMNAERIAQEGLRPDGRQLEIVKRYLQVRSGTIFRMIQMFIRNFHLPFGNMHCFVCPTVLFAHFNRVFQFRH